MPDSNPTLPSMATFYKTPWVKDNPYLVAPATPASQVSQGNPLTVTGTTHYFPSSPRLRVARADGSASWRALVGQVYTGTVLSSSSFTLPVNTTGYGACSDFAVENMAQPALGSVCMWWKREHGLWHLRHYQPWAWSGTPAAVIASIAMQAGMSSAFIDQAAVDAAHDAYTDDAPWAAITAVHGVPTVYCARKVGQTVYSLIEEVIRHTRDFLAISMTGKLAVVSRTNGPAVASLTPADGVIAVEGGSYTTDYLINSVNALFGAAVKTSGDDSNSPNWTEFDPYSAVNEEQLQSYKGESWKLSYEDATSIGQYGKVVLPGQSVSVVINGEVKTYVLAHYPLYLNDAWGAAILTAHATKDATPRRDPLVRQTFLGLDYDVGTQVQNVAVTGDGLTIPVTYCVEKEIDFDDLRVDSLLIEEPAV